MKRIILLAAIAAMNMVGSAHADLIITGVVDGDLAGGLPKAIVLTATADVADLAIYAIGSANNGDGTDGEEFTLSGSAMSGDQILVVSNEDGFNFFQNNFSDLILFTDGSASINGDDAIELFQNGVVIDTYGDINVDGDTETWFYRDGYAVRTGGTAGAFDQANYDSQPLVLDGLDEAQQASALATAFDFNTDATPFVLGDASLNGVVDFDDISPFITLLANGTFLAQADIDGSTVVDFDDIAGFIQILAGP